MKPREVMAEVAKLAAERGWAEGSPQEIYLLGLFASREDARLSLLTAVKAVRSNLDHLDQILQQPSPPLNTLGELQQHPAVVEAKVGEFAAADKALRKYLKAFPAKTEG